LSNRKKDTDLSEQEWKFILDEHKEIVKNNPNDEMLMTNLRIAYYSYGEDDPTALAYRVGRCVGGFYGASEDLPDIEIRKRIDEKLSNLHQSLGESAREEFEKAKSYDLPEEIMEEVKEEWPSGEEILISLESDSEENPANVIDQRKVTTPEEIIDALKELPISDEETDYFLTTGFKQDVASEFFFIYKKGEDFFEIEGSGFDLDKLSEEDLDNLTEEEREGIEFLREEGITIESEDEGIEPEVNELRGWDEVFEWINSHFPKE